MRARVVHRVVLRRAASAATVLALATAAIATADSVSADGDVVAPGAQSFIDLGEVPVGSTQTIDVWLTLVCSGTNAHVDPNQSLTLSQGDTGLPEDPTGTAAISATTVAIDPPGDGWPVDREACPAGAERAATEPSVVTIVAPAVVGEDHTYTMTWRRGLSPVTAGDGAVFGASITIVVFQLDTVPASTNTPPQLVLPSDMTQEGTTVGGAHADYAVGATDAEDDPDPTPVCTPAVGAFVPLGDTTVECSVTDSAGATTTDTFTLRVVDTTPPTLLDVPAQTSAITGSALGTAVTFPLPTAIDTVDPTPEVSCSPASGSLFPLGATLVSCTAADESGNLASASFVVDVRYAVARWLSPIGGDPPSLAGNHGRTVPVKFTLLLDGEAWTYGPVSLVVTQCGEEAVLASVAARWHSSAGRWMAHLDTALLPGPGCYTVTAQLDESAGPSFRLELRGAVEQRASGRAKRG
jgi:hypothetical protein